MCPRECSDTVCPPSLPDPRGMYVQRPSPPPSCQQEKGVGEGRKGGKHKCPWLGGARSYWE